jgi:hypothetical protein
MRATERSITTDNDQAIYFFQIGEGFARPHSKIPYILVF